MTFQNTFNSQKLKLLEALISAGPAGLDTAQVRAFAGNPQSRLAEIRNEHFIRREDTEQKNFFRYFYERERTEFEKKEWKWAKARVNMDKARSALFKGSRVPKPDESQTTLPL